MATTTSTGTKSKRIEAVGPAVIAQRIDKALERANASHLASLTRTYGNDNREHAPKNVSTAIKYARDAMRVEAGEVDLPKAGERRTFIQRIIEAASAHAILSEVLVVEVARDVIAADRARRAAARAADTQTKREHAEALNAAIRQGDIAAAAEAAGIVAADKVSAANARRESAADRFANACKSAVNAGIPLVSLFEALAAAAGVDNPIFTQPADSAETIAE